MYSSGTVSGGNDLTQSRITWKVIARPVSVKTRKPTAQAISASKRASLTSEEALGLRTAKHALGMRNRQTPDLWDLRSPQGLQGGFYSSGSKVPERAVELRVNRPARIDPGKHRD